MTLLRGRTARLPRRRGAAIFEFTIVCMFLLMMLLGVIDFGRFLYVRQLITNAAREGARYATVHVNDKTTAEIQAYVKTVLVGQDRQLDATISVYKVDPTNGTNLGTWNTAGFGQAIAVQIDGTLKPFVPRLIFLPASVPVQSKAIMYSEAN
jgi:Flp pilus assembly protein TadG